VRRDLAALGGASVVVGAALALSPGGTVSGPVTRTALAALGLAVALFGAAAVVGPGSRRGPGDRSLVEDRLGAEFDATLARVETMSAARLRSEAAPEELRERLREAAVALVASRRGLDRETAAGRIERGEWTDDPVAAAFLSESLRAPAAVRWLEYVSTTPRVVSRTRRTVEALEGEL
jgi:hypothetical protein